MPNSFRPLDNLQLRSEEIQEIITTPPAWLIRWGITLVFIITCSVIFLSFLIQYPDFISAKVMVTTLEPTERVMARTSGQIEKVLVVNGETVAAGQRLAGFKSTTKLESVLLLKEVLDSVPFGRANGFEFPIDLMTSLELGEIELAYVDFERSYTEYKLLAALQPYLGQLEGQRMSLVEVHERLKSQLAQKELLERKVALVQIDFDRNKTLYKEGVIAAIDFESKEMDYLQMQEQVNSMAVSISQLQEALVNADQNFRSTRITKEQEETRALVSLVQSYHGLKRAIREWEYQYVLFSSTGGVVSFQGIWAANQFVSTGEHVFSVFPGKRSDLVGKMMITSQNAGKIEIGQRVLIKLDNFPFQQFGTLGGVVKSVSISPDDKGNYFVYTSLPLGTQTSYGKNITLNQELLGTAEIITNNLSVADRLFFKFKSILE